MMLLREQLRWRHDRSLIAILHREQRREQRDDRLATSDVSLEKPMHFPITRHVRNDLANCVRLRAGQRVRKYCAQLRRQLLFIHESDSVAPLTREPICPTLKDVNEEQLL